MFNKQVVFIHTFICSCSQYKNIKYPEHCKVNESVERWTRKKKRVLSSVKPAGSTDSKTDHQQCYTTLKC